MSENQEWEAHHTSETTSREFPAEEPKRNALLDHRSPPHPVLNALLDEALLRIMLVSDGAIGSYRPPLEIVKQAVDRTDAVQRALADVRYNHEGGEKGSSEPLSDLAEILDQLSADYAKCHTHRRRIAVIKDAQTLATRLRYAPSRARVRGTKEWREAIAHDIRPNGTVMIDYGITERHLQRIRKEFGTNRQRGGARQTTRLALEKQTT